MSACSFNLQRINEFGRAFARVSRFALELLAASGLSE